MKNRFKKLKIFIVIISIAISAFVSSAFVDNYFEISKNIDIFTTLFREINLYYVDEVKPGEIIKKGIDSMLEALDPYTNYIPETDIEDYRFMTTGQYGGIGALVRKKGDYIAIAEPYEDSPAVKAGLMAGDLILEVEGKSIKGKNTEDVSKMLKGQSGTQVKILIERPGEQKPIEKLITRQEIKIKSVPYFGVIKDDVGYIRLTQFTENCSKEVKAAFDELKTKNNVKSVILDLRGNPGGLLHESINIVNLFVDKGVDVVSTKGKVQEWNKTYKALNAPVDVNIPVVVLINRGSASASEIVSGSIQDLDRGVVLGQRSYGKGLVQTTRDLVYNSKLKVTTAKYYVPSGRCIQALDYTHRNKDGSVGKIPDSLVTKFKTKNGRVVFDGGGINPDITTNTKEWSKIAFSLEAKSHVFDFATNYRLKKPTITNAKEFRLTDAEYADFVAFVKDKDYDYVTGTDKLLAELKKTAEKEKYFEAASKEYEALKTKMMHNKNDDLITFKTEIKELLEQEIVSRYYLQKGKLENNLQKDNDVKRAIEILNDKKFYTDILTGKYVEPSKTEATVIINSKDDEQEQPPAFEGE